MLSVQENDRIGFLFSEKQKNILSIFCTAGYPRLNATIEVLKALQDNGADMIELGMPYSDPLADGPVIQQSSHIALQNGMTIAVLFEQLAGFRDQVHVPVILMGYMNPVLQYGFDKFCADAADVGIDGLILPDLPMYEFETLYKAIVEKYRLHVIFLVTPETREERIRKIDNLSSGFIYAVSSSSTTGNSVQAINAVEAQQAYCKRLYDMQLKNPFLVGFGIKDAAGFANACRHSRGAIVGSAYINALANAEDICQKTKDFIIGIKE